MLSKNYKKNIFVLLYIYTFILSGSTKQKTGTFVSIFLVCNDAKKVKHISTGTTGNSKVYITSVSKGDCCVHAENFYMFLAAL